MSSDFKPSQASAVFDMPSQLAQVLRFHADCLHGNITDMGTLIATATPRLPVDDKLHYHTMPMKSLSSKPRKLGKNLGRTPM